MSLGRLGKAFRKELTRSPKKAALLGLLCLVALYFWGPLIWSWMPGQKTAKSKRNKARPAAAQPKQAALPQANAAANTSNTEPQTTFHWNQFIRRIEEDRRMRSAVLSDETRDPFRSISAINQSVAAGDEDETGMGSSAKSARRSRRIKPADAGLTLDSVIIGPRFSVAVISGKSVRPGSKVAGSMKVGEGESEQAGQVEYVLEEIHPRHVVLQRAGTKYPLKLKPTKLASGDRLIFQESSP